MKRLAATTGHVDEQNLRRLHTTPGEYFDRFSAVNAVAGEALQPGLG
jgi:hypothetical protein